VSGRVRAARAAIRIGLSAAVGPNDGVSLRSQELAVDLLCQQVDVARRNPTLAEVAAPTQ
jgi:hypothetical protein